MSKSDDLINSKNSKVDNNENTIKNALNKIPNSINVLLDNKNTTSVISNNIEIYNKSQLLNITTKSKNNIITKNNNSDKSTFEIKKEIIREK